MDLNGLIKTYLTNIEKEERKHKDKREEEDEWSSTTVPTCAGVGPFSKHRNAKKCHEWSDSKDNGHLGF